MTHYRTMTHIAYHITLQQVTGIVDHCVLLLYIAGSFYSYNCNCYHCRVDYVGRVCVFVCLSTGHKVRMGKSV